MSSELNFHFFILTVAILTEHITCFTNTRALRQALFHANEEVKIIAGSFP